MFEEPKFDEEGSLIKDSISEEEKNRRLQIGLNNDILITNCGVPLIFVINKSDNPCPKYEDKAEFSYSPLVNEMITVTCPPEDSFTL